MLPMLQHVGQMPYVSYTAINTASKMFKYIFRGQISSNTSFTFKGVFGSALGEEEGK